MRISVDEKVIVYFRSGEIEDDITSKLIKPEVKSFSQKKSKLW